MGMSAGIEWHADESGDPYAGRLREIKAEATPVRAPLDPSARKEPATIAWQTTIARLRALGYTGALVSDDRPTHPGGEPLGAPPAAPGH